MWPHTVAILIGGQSKRMGSPKHLVTLPNGKTMLDMMLAFAKTVSDTIVILGGDVDGQRCVHDLREQQGPVAGIEALLHSGIDTRYLVVGCDMPNLTKKDVEPLLELDSTAVFSFEDQMLGLPLLIKSDELSNCTAYLDSGYRSIWRFVSNLPHTKVGIEEKHKNILSSINSAKDISRMFG